MKRFQFSKIIVLLCFLIAISCIVVGIMYPLELELAIALISAGGTILATTLIFYLKKSQAENTIKIYLSTYKEIIELKQENGEDTEEIIDSMESNIIGKIDSTLDETLADSTSPIEKEDLI